jgi:phosphate starvation-inducible PhoH-like protein
MKIISCLSLLAIMIKLCNSFINIGNLRINNNFLMMKNKDIKLYIPKTENQKKYDNILAQDSNYVLSVIGPPGTGKTLLSCVTAIQKLKENKIDKIIITRPIVSVEEENIGFLPGNLEKKMDPWTRPIYDVFLDFYSKAEINNMIINNKIEISPLGYMRGRTFKNSFILADEMQNSTPNQMLMLLTRIGINSKIVITGDLKQSDLINDNGLEDLVFRFKNKKIPDNFYLIEMNDSDIQRSDIVVDILKIYDKYEEPNKIVKNEEPSKIVKNEEITTIVKNEKNHKVNIYEDDAALIPLKDMSSYFK